MSKVTKHKKKLHDKRPYCGLCNEFIPTKELDTITVDHIIPKSEGGSNRQENLQLAHKFCNRRKAVQPGYFDDVVEGLR